MGAGNASRKGVERVSASAKKTGLPTPFMFLISFTFLQSGQFNEDMIPTVGFNMRKITKGNVTIKVTVLFYSIAFMYSVVKYFKS